MVYQGTSTYRERRAAKERRERFESNEKLRAHTNAISKDHAEHIQTKIANLPTRYRTEPKTLMGGYLLFEYEFPNGYTVHLQGYTAYAASGWNLKIDVGDERNKYAITETDEEKINEILEEIEGFLDLDDSDVDAVSSNEEKVALRAELSDRQLRERSNSAT